jgi:prepilin-type N-terminal cleavage/methylation domain-containing protein
VYNVQDMFLSNRGFTLIELLVVIAIIGILASVIMGDLNTARLSASDASIKQNLNGIRAQAEIVYPSMNNTYAPTLGDEVADSDCVAFVSGTPRAILADITIKNAIINMGQYSSEVLCIVKQESYVISSALKKGGYWCLDNSGNARNTDSSGALYTSLVGADGTVADLTASACR